MRRKLLNELPGDIKPLLARHVLEHRERGVQPTRKLAGRFACQHVGCG